MKLDQDNYVGLAEKVVLELKEDKRVSVVTTSKLRNLLAMTAKIANEVQNNTEERLSNEIKGQINYLKVRMVYEAGREPSVKNFVMKAALLEHLDDIKESRKQFILFSRYMEALIAYRKFHIGRDE